MKIPAPKPCQPLPQDVLDAEAEAQAAWLAEVRRPTRPTHVGTADWYVEQTARWGSD